MDVSENSTTRSSILIGCSIVNHPFWGTAIFENTYVDGPNWEDTFFKAELRRLAPSKNDSWSWQKKCPKHMGSDEKTRILSMSYPGCLIGIY